MSPMFFGSCDTYYVNLSDCLTPPTSSGVTSNFTTTTHGSTVEYSCSYGYEVVGGDTSLECDSSVWRGTGMTCSLNGKKLRISEIHRARQSMRGGKTIYTSLYVEPVHIT